MLPSVRAMFSGIIDYAGMFPPAQLPLEQAIRNYARYRQEPEGWMLGRFVCPASQLAKLSPHIRAFFPADFEIHISALASGANTAAELRAACATDAQAFGAIVDSFELSLSPDALALIAGEKPCQAADEQDLTTACQPIDSPHFYYEIPRGPQWTTALNSIVDMLSKAGSLRKGIKLRCGGATAAAIPSADDVAAAIMHCRDGGVPLKFTAGLHHPFRHRDATLNASVHGFLNVFGAGVLAYAHHLSRAQLLPILEDEDMGRFVFDSNSFRWRDSSATVEQIYAARERLVVSFGSCSFDEPRDDLKALGLIP